MFGKIACAAAVALCLGGCSLVQSGLDAASQVNRNLASGASPTPANTLCPAVANAAANPTSAEALDGLNPHSAEGVLWAQAKSACVGPNANPNVTAAWGNAVIAMLNSALPLLVGAL